MNQATPTLRDANQWLRDGRYAEAAEALRILHKQNPGTKNYEAGLRVANWKLARENGQHQGTEFIHPGSQDIKAAPQRLFSVATAVRNGEPYIKDALHSVLSQTGDFFIDYFVKDARSEDTTLGTLLDFGRRIASGEFQLKCLGLRFRFESSPDNGVYSGLATAFGKTGWRSSGDTVMAYINADDYFHQGSFALVAHLLDELPAQWIIGQIHTVSEAGELICTPEFPLTYAREDILAGYHNGKDLYFIQQEGNFWLRSLYEACGPINGGLRLAGDFELWRRFAETTEPLVVDRPLASFRYREGQLSESVSDYHSEIATILQRKPSSGSETAANVDKPLHFPSRKAPKKAIQQKAGALCFLTPEGRIREVAYIKRGWFCW
jgi:glycosyltransferase involved in cell wall biosynthesis